DAAPPRAGLPDRELVIVDVDRVGRLRSQYLALPPPRKRRGRRRVRVAVRTRQLDAYEIERASLDKPLAVGVVDHVVRRTDEVTEGAGQGFVVAEAAEGAYLGHRPILAHPRQSARAAGRTRRRRESCARGSYRPSWPPLARAGDWRLERARGGLSCAVADLGVPWLGLVEWPTGPTVEAAAAQLGQLHFRQTGDHAGLLVRFSGGLQGVCV